MLSASADIFLILSIFFILHWSPLYNNGEKENVKDCVVCWLLLKWRCEHVFRLIFFSQQCYFEVMIDYFAGVFNVILI